MMKFIKIPPYVPLTSYHVVTHFLPKSLPTVTGLDLNFHRLDKHRQAAKTPEHFGELLVKDILRRFVCDVDRALRCVDEWMWKWGSCCFSQILQLCLYHKKTRAWTWLNLVGMASTKVHMIGELKHNIHDLFLSTSSHSRSIAFSFGIPKHNTKRHRRATADHGNSWPEWGSEGNRNRWPISHIHHFPKLNVL